MNNFPKNPCRHPYPSIDTCFGSHSLTATERRIKLHIPALIEALQACWLKDPKLTLGQLLVNLIQPQTPCPEIADMKDADFLELLESKAK